jgi:hypothetical protein
MNFYSKNSILFSKGLLKIFKKTLRQKGIQLSKIILAICEDMQLNLNNQTIKGI